jgi:hypothetical protein
VGRGPLPTHPPDSRPPDASQTGGEELNGGKSGHVWRLCMDMLHMLWLPVCIARVCLVRAQVLLDRSIREEVLPSLPLHSIIAVLQRYHPEDAIDPLPRGASGLGVGVEVGVEVGWPTPALALGHVSSLQCFWVGVGRAGKECVGVGKGGDSCAIVRNWLAASARLLPWPMRGALSAAAIRISDLVCTLRRGMDHRAGVRRGVGVRFGAGLKC